MAVESRSCPMESHGRLACFEEFEQTDQDHCSTTEGRLKKCYESHKNSQVASVNHSYFVAYLFYDTHIYIYIYIHILVLKSCKLKPAQLDLDHEPQKICCQNHMCVHLIDSKAIIRSKEYRLSENGTTYHPSRPHKIEVDINVFHGCCKGVRLIWPDPIFFPKKHNVMQPSRNLYMTLYD